MAKYTTNFYSLLNMGIYTREDLKSWFMNYELSDYLTEEEIEVIESRGTWNKERLADKIIDTYFFREFGLETPAMFKHYAKIKMRNIMESKLPLIYSAAIKYDPLVNVDFTESFERNSTGTATSSGLNVNSDTPQGQVSKGAILTGAFASSTSADESDGSTSSNEEYLKRVKGNSGVSATAQKMVSQYRENIRAIDYEIIKELKSLFMGIY